MLNFKPPWIFNLAFILNIIFKFLSSMIALLMISSQTDLRPAYMRDYSSHKHQQKTGG